MFQIIGYDPLTDWAVRNIMEFSFWVLLILSIAIFGFILRLSNKVLKAVLGNKAYYYCKYRKSKSTDNLLQKKHKRFIKSIPRFNNIGVINIITLREGYQ